MTLIISILTTILGGAIVAYLLGEKNKRTSKESAVNRYRYNMKKKNIIKQLKKNEKATKGARDDYEKARKNYYEPRDSINNKPGKGE